MNNYFETIILGGGCFWCTEAVFKGLRGVQSVMPGYAGGTTPNPTYHEVSGEGTGHAEVVRVEFDPLQISLEDILTVFFATHDPTTFNRQGNDAGPQYRSVVYYTTEAQHGAIQAFIAGLQASEFLGRTILTEIKPLEAFYPAEEEHRDYYQKNPDQGYCQVVIDPKIQTLRQKFQTLLKDGR
jgi:peptide-methionine (S)-S-oxide reductase